MSGTRLRSVLHRVTSTRRVRELDLFHDDLDRQNAASAARVAGLVLSLGVALALDTDQMLGWLSVLVIFCVGSLGERILPRRLARIVGPAESALVALAACLPATTGMSVFIYLLIPPAAAGLRYGWRLALVASASQGVTVASVLLVLHTEPGHNIVVWMTTALLLGLIGGMTGGSLSATMSRIYASAAYEERRRLSCEIHDGIAQDLAVLGYRVDMLLLQESPSIDPADVAAIGTDIRRILQEARWSIHDLRGGRLPEVGLGTALADHVRRAAATADMTAHLKLTEGHRRLPTAVQMELLRIAQEAVTNARKHSGARNLWVELDVSSGGALLRVSDDGTQTRRRGDGGATEGFGLTIMRERARSIGAEFSYHPRPGGGTVVETRVVSTLKSPAPRLASRPRVRDRHQPAVPVTAKHAEEVSL